MTDQDHPEGPRSELERLREIERRAYDALQLAAVNLSRAWQVRDQMYTEWMECWEAVDAECRAAADREINHA